MSWRWKVAFAVLWTVFAVISVVMAALDIKDGNWTRAIINAVLAALSSMIAWQEWHTRFN